MIHFTAELLQNSLSRIKKGSSFLGHVGGDDFVVASESRTGEALARRIIEEFDEGKVDLHDPADHKRGYLEVESRSGTIERFPLITLTLALVNDAKGKFEHPAELSDVLAELKRFGKTTEQSVIVRDRRSQGVDPELIISGIDAANETDSESDSTR